MSPDVLLSPSPKSEGIVDSSLMTRPLLTPVDTAQAMQLNDTSDSSYTSTKQRDDKLPHDASVFVGSLPSNMDQGDLTRMLMEHLSEHTQIKNIKVVRDSKGGVCAFVQCENAASATSLIQTLHSSPPKPFLGRILRYEPARAFRSLLVSYRMPTQYGQISGPTPSPSLHGQIGSELPTAMRIWKHRNSRFHSILYNSDAINAEENFNTTMDIPWSALFLHPLHFDEESLRKLAQYFGPLENFSPLEASEKIEVNSIDQGQEPYSSYPMPHWFPRSSRMANGCWEIKWEHRDDCVSALMTLRRVPHLTVTWAHQPAPPAQGVPSSYQQGSTTLSYSPQNLHRSHALDTSTSQHTQMPYIFQMPRTSGIIEKGDAVQCATPLAQTQTKGPKETTRYSWANESPDGTRMEESEISMLSLAPHIPVIERNLACAESMKTIQLQARKTPADYDDVADTETQEIYIPQTPALENSSITPTTPGSYLPVTPTDIGPNASQTTPRTGVDCKGSRDPFSSARTQREIDPTTLFVGGLEMFGPGAWDEEKVKAFFSRFGGLECVKVVRPLNSCAAFAFVKFNNIEAPARAVSEEHNRIYEGRAMRVQLRDCNPPRNSWKFNRGRGRPQQHHFSTQRRFTQRSSFGDQAGPLFSGSANQENIHLENPVKQSTLVLQEHPVVIRLSRGDGSSTPDVDSSPLNVTHISSNTPGDTENYREWYEDADPSVHTPEPSSLGSSASTTGVPFSASSSYSYPMSNGPYFAHPPWLHSFPPHIPYQIPYYPGYPVYPPMVQPQHQALPSPPGSDNNGPTAGMQQNWPQMNMYTSYVPYPSMPTRTQSVEQGHQSSIIPAQAPVVPTGFIQNEQGTLIAVYQPEVLDQYLASAVPTMPITPNYLVSNQQRWELTSSQSNESGNTSANPPMSGHQNRPKSAAFPPPQSQQSTTPPRETDINIVNTPLYRRQNPRRENQQGHGFIRQQNHSRSGNNGRANRAHMNYSVNTHPPDLGHQLAQPVISGNWHRWNNLR